MYGHLPLVATLLLAFPLTTQEYCMARTVRDGASQVLEILDCRHVTNCGVMSGQSMMFILLLAG
jgi:hypothetical protein